MVGGRGVHGQRQLQRTYGSRDELGARDGKGYSWKEQINTKSSTGVELVGVDDSLGFILWVCYCYFMQEEGLKEAFLLYQDNMSAMLLETNGRASSLKCTKHIKVKYFFIKDKVNQGKVTIKHCPARQMWTDINTKPKQDVVYHVFRGYVMGIHADYKDSDYTGKVPISPVVLMLPLTKEQPALQECVGGDAKRLERAPIQLTHASGNACISKCSNASGNACIFRHSIYTLAADRPKKKVWIVVDIAVRVPPGEPQQAPLIMVSECAWSPGVYWALRLLGKTLDIAWERAFVCSLTFKN
jgi:hypothetical protein